MARLEVRPMTVEDYCQAAGNQFPWQDNARTARTFIERGAAYAGVVDGELGAVAGVAILWPGVAKAWAILTPSGRRAGYRLTREIIRRLSGLIDTHRLYRVEAEAIATFGAACRWAEFLGFEREGLARQKAPGTREDMILYAWVREVRG